MQEIKFGTDGYRAIIGEGFTVEHVKRISEGVGRWMQQNGKKRVVLGHDTRFGSHFFAQSAAVTFASLGFEVLMDESFVTTPMVSLGVLKLEADIGVVVTASHNPPAYNGYKLKGAFGGPLTGDTLQNIESLIPKKAQYTNVTIESYIESGLIRFEKLEDLYLDHLKQHFDMEKITRFAPKIAYDSMFGAGKKLMKRLFPDAIHIHYEDNPGFLGTPPEPIDRNLGVLMQTVKKQEDILLGIANDGDADRVGLVDEYGNFVDSHQILLLLLYYLAKFKNQSGKVIASAAVTEKLESMARNFGFPFEFKPIGFKHLTPIMLEEDVLLAGEEAGGMALRGHLPERDGIYVSLVILEFMIATGKSLYELVETIYQQVGRFAYDRIDLRLALPQKERIVSACRQNQITQIAGLPVIRTQTVDGFRYFLGEETWLMIRPSGTEPVLRIYAQAGNKEQVTDLLKKAIGQLKKIN